MRVTFQVGEVGSLGLGINCLGELHTSPGNASCPVVLTHTQPMGNADCVAIQLKKVQLPVRADAVRQWTSLLTLPQQP